MSQQKPHELGVCGRKPLAFSTNRFAHNFKIDFFFHIQIILVFSPNEYHLLEQKIIFKVRKTETRGFHSHLYRNFYLLRKTKNSRSRYTAVIYLNTWKGWWWKKIGLSWEFMFIRFILPFKKVLPPGCPSQIENTLWHMQPPWDTVIDTAVMEWCTLGEEVQ